jgi:Family of unknown function (DUF5946)
MSRQDCPYCSANHIGGLEGCQAMYYQVALNTNLPLTSGLGRSIFDAYCLQHPEVYCKSAKSYAAHLAFLYCWIAHPGRQEVLEAIHRGLNGPFKVEKAFVPEVGKRGTLTILHLKRATSLDAIETRATQWINNVWSAYAELHTQAKVYWQTFMDKP